MKTSHLILAAFLAATAWADIFQSRERVASTKYTNSGGVGTLGKSISFRKSQSEFPMVFFAKEGVIYHPLHNFLVYEESKVFAYGNFKPFTEISLQNGYAKSATKSLFAGFNDGFFALDYGETFDYLKIKVDENGKVQNQTFFSCVSELGAYNHIINYNENPSWCFKTEIYLGRYNPRTGQYIKVNFGADGKERKAPERNSRPKWKNWWNQL